MFSNSQVSCCAQFKAKREVVGGVGVVLIKFIRSQPQPQIPKLIHPIFEHF